MGDNYDEIKAELGESARQRRSDASRKIICWIFLLLQAVVTVGLLGSLSERGRADTLLGLHQLSFDKWPRWFAVVLGESIPAVVPGLIVIAVALRLRRRQRTQNIGPIVWIAAGLIALAVAATVIPNLGLDVRASSSDRYGSSPSTRTGAGESESLQTARSKVIADGQRKIAEIDSASQEGEGPDQYSNNWSLQTVGGVTLETKTPLFESNDHLQDIPEVEKQYVISSRFFRLAEGAEPMVTVTQVIYSNDLNPDISAAVSESMRRAISPVQQASGNFDRTYQVSDFKIQQHDCRLARYSDFVSGEEFEMEVFFIVVGQELRTVQTMWVGRDLGVRSDAHRVMRSVRPVYRGTPLN